MTEQLLLESVPLNALDRCDRCGAQAYVRAVLLNGGELMFCAHHGKEYAEKLKPIAAKIQDETEKLLNLKTNLFYRESPYANHRRRAFLVSGHSHKTLGFQLSQ
jgi:HD superfamily phosphodiesterase